MLETLQYPRHLHRSGAFRIVADAAEASQALTEGWTLSPEPPQTPAIEESEIDPEQAPVAPRRKPGRPRTIKE